MKKTMIVLLGVAFLLLLVGSIFLIRSFIQIYGQSQGENNPTLSSEAGEIESFMAEKWDCKAASLQGNTLFMVRPMGLTYEEACRVGGLVFVDDIAPESYLSLVATMQADVLTNFAIDDIRVILVYESTDGEEIFSVDSDGNIQTCWPREMEE
ncbi:MAG: hypothetical protein IKT58_01935 [Oscillospiraceae bacterium]|nr:hypothetical protein [Oscillospiraceae bacterium]